MTKNDLYRRIDELESKLSQERIGAFEAKHQLAQAQDAKTRLTVDIIKIQSDYAKKSKDADRLEKTNKKQMQAIDALKKQLADKEIDRDRYAREVALKLAYAIAKSDNHISTHAKLNYQFITNTEPEPEVDSTLLFNDELKVTHIDEA